MTVLQALTIILISVLLFIVWRRGRLIKKLEAGRPVLDFWTFDLIYTFGVAYFGDENAEVIISTCITTAKDLKAKITVREELQDKIKEEEKYILGNLDPFAIERLETLRHMLHLLPK